MGGAGGLASATGASSAELPPGVSGPSSSFLHGVLPPFPSDQAFSRIFFSFVLNQKTFRVIVSVSTLYVSTVQSRFLEMHDEYSGVPDSEDRNLVPIKCPISSFRLAADKYRDRNESFSEPAD